MRMSKTMNPIEVSKTVITGNVGHRWQITFVKNPGNQLSFVCDASALVKSGLLDTTCTVKETRAGVRQGGVGEIQRIQFPSDASGWLKLSFRGVSTAYIHTNATATEVQNALQDLNGVAQVKVSLNKTTDPKSHSWAITFLASDGDI